MCGADDKDYERSDDRPAYARISYACYGVVFECAKQKPFCTGKGWFADTNTKSDSSLAVTSVYLTHTLLLNASVCCCKQYSITGMSGEDLDRVDQKKKNRTDVGVLQLPAVS